jgi:hypothetical protein
MFQEKIYIYMHICCINHWKEIFHTLYTEIKTSGLHEKIRGIRVYLLSTNIEEDASFFYSLNDEKIELIGYHTNLELYELPTLRLLHDHACREDIYVLYLHTKGVKHVNESRCHNNVKDWVKYLMYFNIQKHDTCLKALTEQGYDCVGVNLKPKKEDHPTHYSGNFWWSKSAYLKKLQPCVYYNYNATEFWLTEKDIGNYLSLWNTEINHYYERYEEHHYVYEEHHPHSVK